MLWGFLKNNARRQTITQVMKTLLCVICCLKWFVLMPNHLTHAMTLVHKHVTKQWDAGVISMCYKSHSN